MQIYDCMIEQTSFSPKQPLFNNLRDSQTLERINYLLSQKGIPTSHPCLRIEVDAGADQQIFELEADDLQGLFSNFGPVESIAISPTHKNAATVAFKDIVSAYIAQQSLHMYYLPTHVARLSVKWNIAEDSHLLDHSTPRSLLESCGSAELESGADVYVPKEHIGKYTCRFYIQIENERNFQVARRLIGPKGRNMKRILDVCSKGCAGGTQEVVKLRLRGKGSGFKEGLNHQESDEPLHLCISSPYLQKYKDACEMCKELLNKVYAEYREFCERTGRTKPQLQIKMIENVMNGMQFGGYAQCFSKDSATPHTAPYSALGPYYYPSTTPYYNSAYKQGYGSHYKYSGQEQFGLNKPANNDKEY
eukprot:TRINITY_DN9909_c0_g1_i9.p1 TRINITY_DN9909_c0_g1~~TRINITY_DN9909_c0_g1_i9.p1  ORF type:complete len:400 (+),score=94.96 TRINITY_DN9909_c0_g1_i9:115-1200(+)